MRHRVLLTGAGGFVGVHLMHYLQQEGFDVHGSDLPGKTPPGNWTGHWHSCDIRNIKDLIEVMDHVQPDYIFHLAALTKSSSLSDLMAVNVLGTQHVLEATLRTRPQARVLVTGSAAEYGLCRPEEMPLDEKTQLRPLSPYGLSKVAQSLLAASYTYTRDLFVVRSRTFNLTGPGEPDTLVGGAFARQIVLIEHSRQPPVLQIGNLRSARDFVDVRDAVRAYVQLTELGKSGQVYNVCSGEATVVRDILEILLSFSDISVSLEQKETRFTRWDIPVQRGTAAALHAATGWKPEISLSQSLSEMLDSWRLRLSST